MPGPVRMVTERIRTYEPERPERAALDADAGKIREYLAHRLGPIGGVGAFLRFKV